jgi:nucleoside-diphosphate-sugar epimerase
VRALVTGCAGFIGSHLTESLLEEGAQVVGVDTFTDNYEEQQKQRNIERATDWETFELVRADLAEVDLAPLMSGMDVIFHLAAEPGVRASWGQRFDVYVRNNVLTTQRLLEALKAQAQTSTRLVFASSSSVYGDAELLPTPESTIPRPVSPYGVTKLSAEHLCQIYGRSHEVETVSLRYFSVYGPRQRPDMAFHRFCRAVLEYRPLVIYGDGTQKRDFTFVADAVAATKSAAKAQGVAGGIFNIGGGGHVSLVETVELIGELAGRALEIQHATAPAGEARDTRADTTYAYEKLGYRPSVSLEAGLSAEFAWMVETLDAETTRA